MEEKIKKCKYFLAKKKRYCKFEVYGDSDFCSHHLNDTSLFIPCPLDPAHSVLASNLEKHLHICPKAKFQKQMESSPWYKKDINIPQKKVIREENEEEKTLLPKSKRFLQELVTNHPKIFEKLVKLIPKALKEAIQVYKDKISGKNLENIDFDLITSENYITDLENYTIEKEISISDNQKNQLQCQDLTTSLQKFNLLDKSTLYVEFGAGKGGLSHFIAEKNNNESKHVLLEIEGRRHKMDKNHRDDPNFIRIRTDIKDFDINALPALFQLKDLPEESENLKKSEEHKISDMNSTNQDHLDKLSNHFCQKKKLKTEEIGTSIVGVTKHMCGAATDLTLYSLLNILPPLKMKGFMISTCCHHRCCSELYANMDYLHKLGFDGTLINPLFNITSWGIYHENPSDLHRETDIENIKYSKIDKTKLGIQAKRILDIGRVLFLIEKGYESFFIKYCDQSYSPENFVIIGRTSVQ